VPQNDGDLPQNDGGEAPAEEFSTLASPLPSSKETPLLGSEGEVSLDAEPSTPGVLPAEVPAPAE